MFPAPCLFGLSKRLPDGPGTNRCLCGPENRQKRFFDPFPDRSRAIDDDKMGPGKNLLRTTPVPEIDKSVLSHDKKGRRLDSEMLDRPRRIGGSFQPSFDIGASPAGMSRNGEIDHMAPFVARNIRNLFVGRMSCRNEQDFRKTQTGLDFARQRDMSAMDRIEGATKKGQGGLFTRIQGPTMPL